ncbi:MAG: riboflavin kinase [Candidatus Doudnabacteria bacterium]|nr:riboflavin kinase [Candidatus Doudnabacteria bacterium]
MKYELGIKILGKVVHGEHYGKILGFPTANLDRRDYVKKKLKIKHGVYAGVALIQNRAPSPFIPLALRRGRGGRGWKAGIVIGPIDSSGLPKIEAHLIGFKGNLYGKHLNIYLNKYLRPFRKFKDEKALKAQMKKDIKLIEHNLKN